MVHAVHSPKERPWFLKERPFFWRKPARCSQKHPRLFLKSTLVLLKSTLVLFLKITPVLPKSTLVLFALFNKNGPFFLKRAVLSKALPFFSLHRPVWGFWTVTWGVFILNYPFSYCSSSTFFSLFFSLFLFYPVDSYLDVPHHSSMYLLTSTPWFNRLNMQLYALKVNTRFLKPELMLLWSSINTQGYF